MCRCVCVCIIPPYTYIHKYTSRIRLYLCIDVCEIHRQTKNTHTCMKAEVHVSYRERIPILGAGRSSMPGSSPLSCTCVLDHLAHYLLETNRRDEGHELQTKHPCQLPSILWIVGAFERMDIGFAHTPHPPSKNSPTGGLQIWKGWLSACRVAPGLRPSNGLLLLWHKCKYNTHT